MEHAHVGADLSDHDFGGAQCDAGVRAAKLDAARRANPQSESRRTISAEHTEMTEAPSWTASTMRTGLERRDTPRLSLPRL